MMRAFEARGDARVMVEPFYGVYLAETGLRATDARASLGVAIDRLESRGGWAAHAGPDRKTETRRRSEALAARFGDMRLIPSNGMARAIVSPIDDAVRCTARSEGDAGRGPGVDHMPAICSGSVEAAVGTHRHSS